MSTITLENVRACSDITMKVRLKDNGVAVDWSGLTDIKALVYSDDQKAVAGRCAVSVDSEDPTVLVCLYAATKPQYLGVNSIIVRAKYMGREKTYDKQAVNIVARTAELEGEQVVLEDPEVTVDIEVTEVDSSLLDAAIAAAFDAADKANEAAEQVPLQVLTEAREATAAANTAAAAANAAGITSVQASIADNEPGTPSVDVALLNKVLSLVFHHLKGVKGDTGATPNIEVGTVTTGEPGTSVIVEMTGTAEAPVLNITIPQGAKGEQGNTGSSVDYPFELVNNLTTDDATKALSAAQGKVLDGKVSQLQQKVDGLVITTFTQGAIRATDGEVISADNRQYTDYIEVIGGGTFKFTRPKSTSAAPSWGMAFYDENKAFVSAIRAHSGDAEIGYYIYTGNIPGAAKYARFTRYSDPSVGDFWIKLTDSYEERISANEEFDKTILREVRSNAATTYYEDASVYFGTLFIRRGNESVVSKVFNTTIQPDEGGFSYVLKSDNTIEKKTIENLIGSDIVLLSYTNSHEVNGGVLFDDYLKKSTIDTIKEIRTIVNVSSTTTYDEATGEVYIGNFTLMDPINGRTNIVLNTSYTLDSSANVLVLLTNGTITRKVAAELAVGDFVLLFYTSSIKKFSGGALLPHFLSKQTATDQSNPFYGKKMVVTGASTDYGTTVTSPYTNSYGYQAAQILGMTYVNYAIGGTCYSKGAESDYEDVFFSLEDFQAATKDTTKKYFVKDGQIEDQRPWHIYQYTNDSWGTIGTTSGANGRTPLVDRLPEMATDADVIIIGGSAGNDWAYRGDNLGEDYLYDGDGAEQNADVAKLTVIGALHLMCRYLMRTYPGKLVLFVKFGAAWRYQPRGISNITWNCVEPNSENPYGYQYSEYAEAIEKVVKQYGFRFINISDMLGMTPYNPRWWCGDTDGKYVHPNLAGHTLGGKALAGYLFSLIKEAV